MDWMFLVVTAGLGHIVTAKVTGDMQYLAGPDNAGVTDLVPISPVEKGPEGCIVVDIGLGRDLGQGFAPLDGMGNGKRVLTWLFSCLSLGIGPCLGLHGPEPRRLSFLLPAPFLCRFPFLPLTVGSPLRRFPLLPFRLFAPDALGIHLFGQQLSLCQGQQIELLCVFIFVIGEEQFPLTKGVFQVGKLLGKEGLAPFSPSDLDGGPGLGPPAVELLGTGHQHK